MVVCTYNEMGLEACSGLGTLLLGWSGHLARFACFLGWPGTDGLGTSKLTTFAPNSASGPMQPAMEYVFYSIGGTLPVFNPLYRHCTTTHKTEGKGRVGVAGV